MLIKVYIVKKDWYILTVCYVTHIQYFIFSTLLFNIISVLDGIEQIVFSTISFGNDLIVWTTRLAN